MTYPRFSCGGALAELFLVSVLFLSRPNLSYILLSGLEHKSRNSHFHLPRCVSGRKGSEGSSVREVQHLHHRSHFLYRWRRASNRSLKNCAGWDCAIKGREVLLSIEPRIDPLLHVGHFGSERRQISHITKVGIKVRRS